MKNNKFEYDDDHYVDEEDHLYTYNVQVKTDLSRTELEGLLDLIESNYYSTIDLNFNVEDDKYAIL